jgi:hypothetical protein
MFFAHLHNCLKMGRLIGSIEWRYRDHPHQPETKVYRRQDKSRLADETPDWVSGGASRHALRASRVSGYDRIQTTAVTQIFLTLQVAAAPMASPFQAFFGAVGIVWRARLL